MADDPKKPALLVKKADAKKGSLWHDFANRRFIKQHGGYDIPEGDLHAIQKFESPLDETPAPHEQTQEVLSDLEKEIQHLKENDTQQTLPPQNQNEYTDPVENQENQHYDDYENEE